MATTAEGVETVEQFDIVRAAGRSEVQGWLFSRSGPLVAITALLAGSQPAAVPAAPALPGGGLADRPDPVPEAGSPCV